MTDAPETFPDMMDTHQVARYLRVKERKIYDLLKDRKIPCVRVTGKWLFPKADIDEWLKQNTDAGGGRGRPERPPLVVAGSHDPLLEWAIRQVAGGLAVLPGTSADGLAKMAAGEAALAGLHLRNGETYNVSQVAEVLAGHNVVLIRWAGRRQGLVVAPGNPLGLGNLEDLALKPARVVMRQGGSGSRVLFESLIQALGIDAARLTYAAHPALTETEIGLAILEDAADAGLAVESVARTLRLGFVPVMEERFDLVIHRQAYFEPPVQALLAFARSAEFAAKAEALGGYDLSGLGDVRWNAL